MRVQIIDIILAVLNSEHSTVIPEKEAWFTTEEDAMGWLKGW